MKWLIIPALLLVACAGIYWMIPAKLEIVKFKQIHCSTPAVDRALSAHDKWLGSDFRVTKKLPNALELTVNGLPGFIHLLPLPSDSTAIQWNCTLSSGWSPVARIKSYQQAKVIRQKMSEALDSLARLVENKANIYGIAITETPLYDTVLVATKTTLTSYPNTQDFYSLVKALQRYSASQQAQQTGSPMVNITHEDLTRYQLMVALPINKRIPDKGEFFYRRMIPRKFLHTEARGGEETVKFTEHQLQQYINDFHRTVMALPFQMLVTDRSAEPDTTKWVTKIYVPIY